MVAARPTAPYKCYGILVHTSPRRNDAMHWNEFMWFCGTYLSQQATVRRRSSCHPAVVHCVLLLLRPGPWTLSFYNLFSIFWSITCENLSGQKCLDVDYRHCGRIEHTRFYITIVCAWFVVSHLIFAVGPFSLGEHRFLFPLVSL